MAGVRFLSTSGVVVRNAQGRSRQDGELEKSASECDGTGGTSAPKKTTYIRRDSNPDRQKVQPKLFAAAPSVLTKKPLSAAMPFLGSPEKPRRDSSTSMPNTANIVGVKKEF